MTSERRFEAGPRSLSVCEGRVLEWPSGTMGALSAADCIGSLVVGCAGLRCCSSCRLVEIDRVRLNRALCRDTESTFEVRLAAFCKHEEQIHCPGPCVAPKPLFCAVCFVAAPKD